VLAGAPHLESAQACQKNTAQVNDSNLLQVEQRNTTAAFPPCPVADVMERWPPGAHTSDPDVVAPISATRPAIVRML